MTFILMGLVFVFGAIGIAGRILRGRTTPFERKRTTYECGEPAVGSAWIRFNPRFLLLAVVFVIFDVEIAFLFPWAVAYRAGGLAAFLDMIVFIAILLAGYLWFWNLGELRWIVARGNGVGDRSG